jgi:SAM-dependent methyltransferase
MYDKVNFGGYKENNYASRWEAVIEEQNTKRICGETGKAHLRRLREGWYDKYCPADKVGLDVGAGEDPVHVTFRRWDLIFSAKENAVDLSGIETETFWTVFSSHVLEHLEYPQKALKEWWRVLKRGGHLCVMVPHRDLYEKRRFLPSQWNPDHRYFWLPDEEDPPCTRSLRKEITEAIPNGKILELRVLDDGYDHLDPKEHPIGEYSIEAVVKKL